MCWREEGQVARLKVWMYSHKTRRAREEPGEGSEMEDGASGHILDKALVMSI